jgi:KRAB domain-containing zinc finger protein
MIQQENNDDDCLKNNFSIISGVMEVHTCPECGKTFGRKSNLKAHRESLHYGKKFPCPHCDRIFTNRSSMNQHIKKTHVEMAAHLLQ